MDILGSIGNYAGSALATAVYGTGVSDRVVGKITSRMLMKMLFSQGWQWAVEIDGLPGADFFCRDITYSDFSIETDPMQIGGGEINVPSRRVTGPLTMTVRDSVDGLVARWFDGAKSKVVNLDGTVNYQWEYSFNIRIYHLLLPGATLLEKELTVFPTLRGEIMLNRDAVAQFHSFPLTFTQVSTFINENERSLFDKFSYSL